MSNHNDRLCDFNIWQLMCNSNYKKAADFVFCSFQTETSVDNKPEL